LSSQSIEAKQNEQASFQIRKDHPRCLLVLRRSPPTCFN